MFGFVWKLHWAVYVVLAGIVLYFGFELQKTEIKLNNAREVALQAPVPAVVDAGDITSDSFSEAREINVGAQIVPDAVYEVSVSGWRTVDREKLAFFALSQTAEDKSAEIRVIFLFDKRADLGEVLGKFATGEIGAVSPIVHVNGEMHYPGGKLGGVIADAAQQSGLTLARNVLYVEPFFTSREEALMARATNGTLAVMALISAALLAYGGLRFWLSRRAETQVTKAE